MPNHFFGTYPGVVTDDQDPSGLMRIRVRIPKVVGDQISTWATPCVPPGCTATPKVGAGVWIVFEDGDPDFPIWIGTFLGENTG